MHLAAVDWVLLIQAITGGVERVRVAAGEARVISPTFRIILVEHHPEHSQLTLQTAGLGLLLAEELEELVLVVVQLSLVRSVWSTLLAVWRLAVLS